MKPAGYITPAQLQVLQGFGGAGQVQLKVRTRADETHTVALVAVPDDQVLVPRELLSALIGEISHGWGESFEESEIAEQIRTLLHP